MELKQQLRLTQQLVMTPQLQQAIRLLQLSRLELIDEVRKELDGNPILSSEDEPEPKTRASDEAPRNGGTAEAVNRPNDGGDSNFSQAEQNSLGEHKVEAEKATREVDWEKFLENRTQQQAPSLGPRSSDDLPPFEQNLTKPHSLADHMRWQLQMSDFTDVERRFAELVIGNLDEKGYLDLEGVERPDGTRTPDLTIEDLAEEAGLHPDDSPLVLEMIQNFDPVGVAARSLQECLLIQAKAFGYDSVEITILEKHMTNLEKHNYQAIARDMKISLEETYEAAKEIQKLESRPARNFTDADDKMIAITPDVYVVKNEDDFVVLDNDRGVQRLYINEALTKRMLTDPQAKEFVGEKLRNAQWLIRAIEQRRKTIIRVTDAIVKRQRDFFEKGVAYRDEGGALVVTFDDTLPSCLLQKSDGGTLYQTRDAATCLSSSGDPRPESSCRANQAL